VRLKGTFIAKECKNRSDFSGFSTTSYLPQSRSMISCSNIMSDPMSQGVDIQLRILQALVSLFPNFPAIHGDLLGDVRVTETSQ
jgi:hypothetical protein